MVPSLLVSEAEPYLAVFQGFPCDCAHDRHVPVVDERLMESLLRCSLEAYVNLLRELLGVDLRTCSSSNWIMDPLDRCSWRCPTCSRAVGDGFVCVNVYDV